MTQTDSALSVTIDTSALTPGLHQVQARATDYADNTSGPVNTSFRVYSFTGCFQPVDNTPTLNKVKAGHGIPVKFSLSGNQGLNIFAAGYPISQSINCNSTAPADLVEQTVTAGSSSLAYDPTADQYVYVWKTEKGWAGPCRQLVVQFTDASIHVANFQFTK